MGRGCCASCIRRCRKPSAARYNSLARSQYGDPISKKLQLRRNPLETQLNMVGKSARTRLPLASLGRLTLLALVGLALCLAYLQAAIIGTLIPPLAVFAAISLLMAGIVGFGWRWAPALGALWSIFIIVGNSEGIFYNFAHPNNAQQ